MSRLLQPDEYVPDTDFEIGDRVCFNHGGLRLHGRVTRVYNARDLYHVEVDGKRYSVNPCEDRMAHSHRD